MGNVAVRHTTLLKSNSAIATIAPVAFSWFSGSCVWEGPAQLAEPLHAQRVWTNFIARLLVQDRLAYWTLPSIHVRAHTVLSLRCVIQDCRVKTPYPSQFREAAVNTPPSTIFTVKATVGLSGRDYRLKRRTPVRVSPPAPTGEPGPLQRLRKYSFTRVSSESHHFFFAYLSLYACPPTSLPRDAGSQAPKTTPIDPTR